MNFANLKTITVSAIGKSSFQVDAKFMLKTATATFEFWKSEGYGRMSASKGLNITNWSRKYGAHVVTLLEKDDCAYVLAVMDTNGRETFDRFCFSTLKEVREFISDNHHNL